MPRSRPLPPHVAVVGGGAFGGWTAFELIRLGIETTLIEEHLPGHADSASGGEVRLIRGSYGGDPLYTSWAVRSLTRWRQFDGGALLEPTGLLWLYDRDRADYAEASLELTAGTPFALRRLRRAEVRELAPRMEVSSDEAVFWEPGAACLQASMACRRVATAVTGAGGRLLRARAEPGTSRGPRLLDVRLGDGTKVAADAFVLATGAQMSQLPELADRLHVTRQDVLFFTSPDPERPCFPPWMEMGERILYGIPHGDSATFKIGDDTRDRPVPPLGPDPPAAGATVRRLRDALRRRFPHLADAPVSRSHVCRYTNTPAGDFVLARHPRWENVWLAGGGSGHGFKFGPVVGRHVAQLVAGAQEPLERFACAGPRGAGRGAGGPFERSG